MAVIPRDEQGRGWLSPALGVMELSQCIVQVLRLFQLFFCPIKMSFSSLISVVF